MQKMMRRFLKKKYKLLNNNIFNYSKKNDDIINNILINKFRFSTKKNIKNDWETNKNYWFRLY